MKLKEWKHERTGDRIKISAKWTDQMRHPSHVQVAQQTKDAGTLDGLGTVIEGDAGACFKTLEGLAVIAWGMGWRPPGLVNEIAETVQKFKP